MKVLRINSDDRSPQAMQRHYDEMRFIESLIPPCSTDARWWMNGEELVIEWEARAAEVGAS